MSKEERYRENIAWLSRLVDDGYVRVAWTTQPHDWTAADEYTALMRFIGTNNCAAQVSDAITIVVSKDQYAFESALKFMNGHRGWPVEILRMAPPPQKKVDYSQITREIVGDLR